MKQIKAMQEQGWEIYCRKEQQICDLVGLEREQGQRTGNCDNWTPHNVELISD